MFFFYIFLIVQNNVKYGQLNEKCYSLVKLLFFCCDVCINLSDCSWSKSFIYVIVGEHEILFLIIISQITAPKVYVVLVVLGLNVMLNIGLAAQHFKI